MLKVFSSLYSPTSFCKFPISSFTKFATDPTSPCRVCCLKLYRAFNLERQSLLNFGQGYPTYCGRWFQNYCAFSRRSPELNISCVSIRCYHSRSFSKSGYRPGRSHFPVAHDASVPRSLKCMLRLCEIVDWLSLWKYCWRNHSIRAFCVGFGCY